MSRLLAVVCLVAATQSQAGVTIHFQQVGGDVVATASGAFGSWDGLTSGGTTSAGNNQAMSSSAPQVGMGDQSASNWMASVHAGYLGSGGNWLSKPTNLGLTSYSYYAATTNTGTYKFFVNASAVYIEQSYTLNTQLNNVSTWTNKSLASLGLAQGTYTWSWAGDSLSVVVGTPVPEPSAYGLALGGLALVGAAIRRRKTSK